MSWLLVGDVLVVVGGLIFVVAAVGLHRLPDPFTRASAVATAAGLGVAFVVAGAAFVDPGLGSNVKAVIAIVLQLLTSAVAGIVIARSAVLSGHRFMEGTDTAEIDGTTAASGTPPATSPGPEASTETGTGTD